MSIRPVTARGWAIRCISMIWGLFICVVVVPFLTTITQQWPPLKAPENTAVILSQMATHAFAKRWIFWPVIIVLLFFTGFTVGVLVESFLKRTERTPLLRSLPLGSLQFVKGIMEVGHSKSTGNIYVQLQVEIFNENDFMIEFTAVLSGNANGVTPEPSARSVAGHIAAKGSSLLTYDRILGAKFNDNSNFNPAVVAFLKYDLKYKEVGAKDWTRASAKSLRFSQPFNYVSGATGTNKVFPTTVLVNSSSET